MKKRAWPRVKMAATRLHAGAAEHVAELRDRGVGQHPFDVILRDTDGCGEYGGGTMPYDPLFFRGARKR